MKTWQQRCAPDWYFDTVRKGLQEAGLTELYYFSINSPPHEHHLKTPGNYRATNLVYYLNGYAFLISLNLHEGFRPSAGGSGYDPYTQHWELDLIAELDDRLLPKEEVEDPFTHEKQLVSDWANTGYRFLTCANFPQEGSGMITGNTIFSKNFNQRMTHRGPYRKERIIEAVESLRAQIGSYLASGFTELSISSLSPTFVFPGCSGIYWKDFPMTKLCDLLAPGGTLIRPRAVAS